MGLIDVKEANCKNCYRCLKGCLVKSLKYQNNKVEVIEQQCVLCGHCIVACEQKAKILVNDVDRVKRMAKDPDCKTVVSLAPSFIAAYGLENQGKVVAALKRLGFDYVEETSIGAYYVTLAYRKMVEEQKRDVILTTCCPTVNLYVTKYFPNLTHVLAPAVSPMVAHGQLIKKHYGPDTKVIFVGPCVSKLDESDKSPDVDGALTFGQVNEWMEQEGIFLEAQDPEPFDRHSNYSRIYPIQEGIVRDLQRTAPKNDRYDYLSVSGLKNVKDLLGEIQSGQIHDCFIEVNACNDGCINGPMMPTHHKKVHSGRLQVQQYAGKATAELEPEVPESIYKTFTPEAVKSEIPGHDTIRSILAQIGKPTEEQELNCGSCGYPTCKDKAIAVYQGKAQLYMCMPYMYDISQTLANVTLSATPNYIIAVDETMKIKEFNLAAQELFQVSRSEALQKYLFDFIDPSDFEEVIRTKQSIYNKKVRYDDLGISTEQTIVYVQDQNLAIGIFQDITKEEKASEQAYQRKLNSVEMAQKVIDKQMVVAQEIASLLGETTAETKVTLNNLKRLIVDGNDNE